VTYETTTPEQEERVMDDFEKVPFAGWNRISVISAMPDTIIVFCHFACGTGEQQGVQPLPARLAKGLRRVP
jgi:hypothetical protein